MASNDGPVGKLFVSHEADGHDIEVVTLAVDFDVALGCLRSVTYVSVDVGNTDDPRITLQRLHAQNSSAKSVDLGLEPEEFHVLLRESSILQERRIKKSRGRDR